MKYVRNNTAMVETSDWAELERIRLAISMRSRIVRPTLAKVGARLPPVSDCTDSAEANKQEGFQRDALRQSVIGRAGIVSKTDAADDLFQLRDATGCCDSRHGVLQGIGDAGPRLQGGHHQVDGIGQLRFDSCASAPPPDRPPVALPAG